MSRVIIRVVTLKIKLDFLTFHAILLLHFRKTETMPKLQNIDIYLQDIESFDENEEDDRKIIQQFLEEQYIRDEEFVRNYQRKIFKDYYD